MTARFQIFESERKIKLNNRKKEHETKIQNECFVPNLGKPQQKERFTTIESPVRRYIKKGDKTLLKKCEKPHKLEKSTSYLSNDERELQSNDLAARKKPRKSKLSRKQQL